MKYKQDSFFQVSRLPFRNYENPAEINQLSLSSFKLYVWLHELEHRFTGPDCMFFFRSDRDLMNDVGMSKRTITRSKKQLVEFGFITTWMMHWLVEETGKKSEKHVTAYRILK